jgi:hypothetical protein
VVIQSYVIVKARVLHVSKPGVRQGETISAVLGRNVPVDDDIRDRQWSARIALLVSKRALTSTIPVTLVLSPESLLPKTALPLQPCPGK